MDKEEAKSESQNLKAQDLLRNMDERRKLLQIAKREMGAWKFLRLFPLITTFLGVVFWQFFTSKSVEVLLGIALLYVLLIIMELGQTQRSTDALIKLIGEENLLKKPVESK